MLKILFSEDFGKNILNIFFFVLLYFCYYIFFNGGIEFFMCWYYINVWVDLLNVVIDWLKVKISYRSCLLDLFIKNDESLVYKYDKYFIIF